jgi:hypothetical protein
MFIQLLFKVCLLSILSYLIALHILDFYIMYAIVQRNAHIILSVDEIGPKLSDLDVDVRIKPSKKGGALFGNLVKSDSRGEPGSITIRFPLPHQLNLVPVKLGTNQPEAIYDFSSMSPEQKQAFIDWLQQFEVLFEKARLKYESLLQAEDPDWSVYVTSYSSKQNFSFKLESAVHWGEEDFVRLSEIRQGHALVEIDYFWCYKNQEKKKAYIGPSFRIRHKAFIPPKTVLSSKRTLDKISVEDVEGKEKKIVKTQIEEED